MLVAGLFGGNGIPGDPRRGLGDRGAGKIGEDRAGLRDHSHLLVAQEHDVARVLQDGRNVGGHEVLTVAKADHHGRTVAHGHDLLRVVGREQHQREEPAQARHGAAHRAVEPVVLPLALDQMGHHLGVGLGDEGVAL